VREEVAGAAGPPPQAPPPSGLRGRLEDLGYRIPFRVKLALVWLVIFAILAVLFSAAKFDTQWIRDNFWFITKGLWVTIFIAVVSIFFAIILALFGALGRLSKSAIAYGVTGFYTSFFRGTPLIVQMFLIYLGLPTIGQAFREPIRGWFLLSPIVAGIVALSLNYGAYMTEIFRAGIQSVSHGQTEAAEALGMTYRQRMRRVVLPQAIRVIIPPTGNDFIAMMKDTALVTLLGTPIAWADPFRRATLLGRADFRNLEALLIAAAWYWILTAVFSYFQGRLENRLSKGYVRQVGNPRGRQGGQPKTKFVSSAASGGAGGGADLVQIPVPGPGPAGAVAPIPAPEDPPGTPPRPAGGG
jgi:polar amino acid transport system permease protein